MEKMCKDFSMWTSTKSRCDGSVMVMARDKEVKAPDERWVFVSLSEEEAIKVYEFLKEHLNK